MQSSTHISTKNSDGVFEPLARKSRKRWWWLLLAAVMAIVVWAMVLAAPIPAMDPATAKAKQSSAAAKLGMPVRQQFTVNGVSFSMVVVPEGVFTMGCTQFERYEFFDQSIDWNARDYPNSTFQHKVSIRKPFLMSETEVTQALWEAVMRTNPSEYKGAQSPVEQVEWLEAQKFLRRLSDLTGKRFRLPTEAEWEYACRAGTTGQFGGSGDLDTMGWSMPKAQRTTHPVGQKLPNAWGLFDMHGNVCEWCSSLNKPYPYSDSNVWVSGGPDPILYYLPIHRGGGIFSGPADCRSSARDWMPNRIGLRMVMDVAIP